MYFLLLSSLLFLNLPILPFTSASRHGAVRGVSGQGDVSWLVAGPLVHRKASPTDWAAFDEPWAVWRVQIRGPFHSVGPLNTTGLSAQCSVISTTLTSGFCIYLFKFFNYIHVSLQCVVMIWSPDREHMFPSSSLVASWPLTELGLLTPYIANSIFLVYNI